MELNYILSTKDEKRNMKNFYITPKRGTLLYGPPGNGKTTFAEALAGEGDFYYIKVLSKDFSGYSSIDTIHKLELIFENTIKLSKMTDKKGIVLFFDEIDTLIRIDMDKTVRGTLLDFLENKNGIKADDSKIILMAATNFKELLDEASIRDGRFDSKLEVYYPNEDSAIAIMKKFFEDDKKLDISSLNSEFYIKLYNKIKLKKENEITKANNKISNEKFWKTFEGIPIIELKNIKNEIKRIAYFSNYKKNSDKIIINNDIINNIFK
jgi:SpoVK/Ycf46/Vps4 family AAA+-type ATPase